MNTEISGLTVISFLVTSVERIQLVATGHKWIGYGVGSFFSVTQNLLDSAVNELALTVYIITDEEIVESVRNALDRGVSAHIFINDRPGQKTKETPKVISLGEEYSQLRIHLIKENVLHAKVLVADAQKVLLGSANPTFQGMVTNYEMGVLIESGKIAQKVLSLLHKLSAG